MFGFKILLRWSPSAQLPQPLQVLTYHSGNPRRAQDRSAANTDISRRRFVASEGKRAIDLHNTRLTQSGRMTVKERIGTTYLVY